MLTTGTLMKELEKYSPLKRYPIGSTVQYRRENGEIIDLTVEDYDRVIDVFKLAGVVDDLPLELNMNSRTLKERTVSKEAMNAKYPPGTPVGYRTRKMNRIGQPGPEVTGEGTVYDFKDGKYIINIGPNKFIPVKEENLYELDSPEGQIEQTRTTLQGPFGKTKQ